MIVAWETNEKGEPTSVLGLFKDETELKAVVLPLMGEGKTVLAGDIVPFSLAYVPPAVTVKRTTTSALP